MKPLEALRAIYGLAEVLSPRWIPGMALGYAPDRPAAAVIRVLGARHLVQALLSYRAGRSTHRIGATVDLLHAASMAGLAVVDKKHRAPALLSAAIAAAFALGELL